MTKLSADAHRLMSQQYGVASSRQLLTTGLSPRQVQHLADTGQLVRVARGAYASPSVELSELARCVALCLARQDLVVAGPTAGRIWNFRHVSRDLRIHVIAPPHAQPSTDPRIAVYRTAAIYPDDVIVRPDGLRVTSRARTALDLARHVEPRQLMSIIEQAMRDGNLSDCDMRRPAVDWISPQRRWLTTYLEQLDRRLPGKPADSRPEVDLGQALLDAGIHGLERQFDIDLPEYGPARFDLAIPAIRWAIEVDVHPTHRDHEGAASDRRRDAGAVALDWLVSRVSRERYERWFGDVVTDLVQIYHARHGALR